MPDKQKINDALNDLINTFSATPYNGFENAYVAVVKIANQLEGDSEHKRMLELLRIISEDNVKAILQGEGVKILLELHPPLENILYSRYEHLFPEETKKHLEQVRLLREVDPQNALKNLAYVLKRIRNKRAHGFKSTDGPRDNEILSAGMLILRDIAEYAVAALGVK